MTFSRWYPSAIMAVAAAHHVRAADVPFLTEMGLYSQLAECAQSAVMGNYLPQTETTECGPDVTKLQSCFCSQTTRLNSVYSDIRASVSASCGTIGTDDLASVSQVISKYCTPDADITFATPTTNIVNQLVTDVAEFTYLPICAQSGVSSALYSASRGCPAVDNMYAPCVCNKKGVVDRVQESITREVRSSCSNGEDATIAANFFSDYCNMNNGTTSFAPPQGPPGDMTYYITALSQFKALDSCAQSGLEEAVMGQSYSLCPQGPQAMASCACLKSGVLARVSQALTSSVKADCGNTANVNVSSAAEVLDFYCQAAENKVQVSVIESIAETYATGSVPNTSRPTRSGGPAETGSSNGSNGGSGGDGKKSGGLSRAAVIAISVLAAVIAIALIVGIALFVRRKNKKKAAAAAAAGASAIPHDGSGHSPELQGASKFELPGGTGSPVSELASKSPAPAPAATQQLGYPPPQAMPYGQQPQYQPNMHSTNHLSPYQGSSPSELGTPAYGYSQSPHTVSASTAQGAGPWGPPQPHELDSNHRQ